MAAGGAGSRCCFCSGPTARPRTDLFGETSSGGGDPVGGSAAGALIDPPAGTADVPTNLAAIAVRLPVALALDAAGPNAPFRLRRFGGAR